MKPDFHAFDILTANHAPSSVCWLGVARVIGGVLAPNLWSHLINPETPFAKPLTEQHEIDGDMVRAKPTLSAVWDEFSRIVSDSIVVTYGTASRDSLLRAARQRKLPLPPCLWADARAVALRTRPDLQSEKNEMRIWHLLTAGLRVDLDGHDRRAAVVAHLMASTLKNQPLPIMEFTLPQPMTYDMIATAVPKQLRTEPTGEGEESASGKPLEGEVICFTGKMTRGITQPDARRMAMEAGAMKTGSSVSGRTTMLVEGEALTADALDGRTMAAIAATSRGIPILHPEDFIELVKDWTTVDIPPPDLLG